MDKQEGKTKKHIDYSEKTSATGDKEIRLKVPFSDGNSSSTKEVSDESVVKLPMFVTGGIVILVGAAFLLSDSAHFLISWTFIVVFSASLIVGKRSKVLLTGADYPRFLNSVVASTLLLFVSMYWVVDMEKIKRKYFSEPISLQYYFDSTELGVINSVFTDAFIIFDDGKNVEKRNRASITSARVFEREGHYADYKSVKILFCKPSSNDCWESQVSPFKPNGVTDIGFGDQKSSKIVATKMYSSPKQKILDSWVSVLRK